MLLHKDFLQGAAIGLSVAVPVGPMALLCISRTLLSGPLTGFVSGLAAATVDLLFAFVGAFGLDLVSSFFLAQHFWLRLLGTSYLLYLAVKIFRSVPRFAEIPSEKSSRLSTVYGSTVLLNLTNPMTILPFIALFAGAGMKVGSDWMSSAVLLSGVFIGASSWWLLLSLCCTTFRKGCTQMRLGVINRCSALALALFALYSFYRLAID